MNKFIRLRTKEIHTQWKSGVISQQQAKEKCEAMDEEWDARLDRTVLTDQQLICEWEKSRV